MNVYYVLVVTVAFVNVANSCHPGWFECHNLKCVPGNRVCDHRDDCGDLSDEIDFETGRCAPGQLYCLVPGGCIPATSICDGVNDCTLFHEDEVDPETGLCPECPAGAVKCANGQCIYEQWQCDGIFDCNDMATRAKKFVPNLIVLRNLATHVSNLLI